MKEHSRPAYSYLNLKVFRTEKFDWFKAHIQVGSLLLITIFFLVGCRTKEVNSYINFREADSVVIVPGGFGPNSFYRKYILTHRLPIISSDSVPNKALTRAAQIISHMLLKKPTAVDELLKLNIKVAIMGAKEVTTDIPEHSDLNMFSFTNWDTRARGLGATIARPISTCAEENILCYSADPYHGEDILVHEFAHTMSLAFLRMDVNFAIELAGAYTYAKHHKLWSNTYAISNSEEYFAEGVQSWFDVNQRVRINNGIHNEISTREKLRKYDTRLYKLLSEYFTQEPLTCSCNYYKAAE